MGPHEECPQVSIIVHEANREREIELSSPLIPLKLWRKGGTSSLACLEKKKKKLFKIIISNPLFLDCQTCLLKETIQNIAMPLI